MSHHLQALTAFQTAALAVVRRIPRGRVLSYGVVARRAGYPGAARAIGTLMKHNRDPRIPCHRVVRSDGQVGEYAFGGTRRKIERLIAEGVEIRGRRVVAFGLRVSRNAA